MTKSQDKISRSSRVGGEAERRSPNGLDSPRSSEYQPPAQRRSGVCLCWGPTVLFRPGVKGKRGLLEIISTPPRYVARYEKYQCVESSLVISANCGPARHVILPAGRFSWDRAIYFSYLLGIFRKYLRGWGTRCSLGLLDQRDPLIVFGRSFFNGDFRGENGLGRWRALSAGAMAPTMVEVKAKGAGGLSLDAGVWHRRWGVWAGSWRPSVEEW
eukprot:1365345-Amorphochlora_amoeboformis.AAC.2